MKKYYKLKSRFYTALITILFAGFFAACEKDEIGTFNSVNLDSVLAEAENLVTSSQEGTNPGDYKPGSINNLQQAIDWVYWQIENGENQKQVDDAAVKLQYHIDLFKNQIVVNANPWIHQVAGSYIMLGDNLGEGAAGTAGQVKQITKKAFTVEAKLWIVGLQQKGWSNVVFANVMGLGGSNDRGFGVRYFGDGKIEFIVGGLDYGWAGASAPAGTLKANQWVHIAFVNNINNQKLYVDGVEVASLDVVYADSDDEYPLTIGAPYPWNDRVVNSMVKDFRFWTEAKTTGEIASLSTSEITGNETGLEINLPLNADLGTDFADATKRYRATLVGNIEWVPDGDISNIPVDYLALQTLISEANTIIDNGVFGTEDGNYPVDAKEYLEIWIGKAQALIDDKAYQLLVDEFVEPLTIAIQGVKGNLVADADGIYIPLERGARVTFGKASGFFPASYTVELKVKLDDLNKLGGWGYLASAQGAGGWGLRYRGITPTSNQDEIDAAGKLQFFMDSNGGWAFTETEVPVLIAGEWINVAASYDENTGLQTLYINGEIVAQGTDVQPLRDFTGDIEVALGIATSDYSRVMHGALKDFRFWSTARSQADLHTSISGTESDLECYYPFDKVAGVWVTDVTGKHKAEFVGADWNK
ncbi:LamG domain-containing protein [uncultured Draconibacterium sp.]|uniref:LamG domain-containing protein n=1 Tax=uncultured Draconibacterium sp. TaxID=1573823 RepID=UPI0029BFB19E|nr:LamG domain-containing protein [uncultured Draconibacterium sp.]